MAKRNNGQGFVGEIIHFHAVRMRVTGSGSLNLFLRSLDDVNNSTLTPVSMVSVTNREPVILANYKDQRGQLELKTVLINETFTVSKIIIFVKPISTGYPQ